MCAHNSGRASNGRVLAHRTKSPAQQPNKHLSADKLSNNLEALAKPKPKPKSNGHRVDCSHHSCPPDSSHRPKKTVRAEKCTNHPVASRNKKLARLQQLRLLYKLKPRQPRHARKDHQSRKDRPGNQEHTMERVVMPSTLPAEQVDTMSVSSSDDQAKSVGSTSSVTSGSTNITTPDLSDSEYKPDAVVTMPLARAPGVDIPRPITSGPIYETTTAPATHPTPVSALTAPSDSKSAATAALDTAGPRESQLSPPVSNLARKRKLLRPDRGKDEAAKKVKTVPASRPKEYFETRVAEMLDDPLGFDDLVYKDPRPWKAKQIAAEFRKFRKAQGRPISVEMSGGRQSDRLSPLKRRKSWSGSNEDLAKEVLTKAHEERIGRDSQGGNRAKRRMSAPGLTSRDLFVKGYLGNQKDRTDSEGGILVGVVTAELRTGPRSVGVPHRGGNPHRGGRGRR